MKGSEIDDPGHLIGLKPRRFPNWGARQQPIKICPLCSAQENSSRNTQNFASDCHRIDGAREEDAYCLGRQS